MLPLTKVSELASTAVKRCTVAAPPVVDRDLKVPESIPVVPVGRAIVITELALSTNVEPAPMRKSVPAPPPMVNVAADVAVKVAYAFFITINCPIV
jgi:hypothetical protein